MKNEHKLQDFFTIPNSVQHPLEPLTTEEMAEAIRIVRAERNISESFRFVTVMLHEPLKSVVLNFKLGDVINREVFMILLDKGANLTYEVVVSLNESAVKAWKPIPNVQPSIMLEELSKCEALVKANPDFRAALRKRGITNLDLVMVDPWPAGHYNIEEEKGLRLVRPLCWIRSSPTDNGYAHPIEGVIPYIDLATMTVLKVEDYGIVPLPPEPGNYVPDLIGDLRGDLKPLNITQPEGPSFKVQNHQVCWQKWQFRIGFNSREGLVLHTINYEDQGRIRPIIYRASLSEMVVPYGDPEPQHFRKNAFDVGEAGLGFLVNSLKIGCDCLGEIRYFDAVMSNNNGDVVTIPNAICMHEEDYGILWKHMDWRTEQSEVRRSRRLVVSFIANLGNYDYGFFWYFYQDGTIQYEVKHTGIVNTAAVTPGKTPKYGSLIAPQLNAPIHQHFYCVRLDMSIDGQNNSVYEVNTESEPLAVENPHGNAFFAKETLLATESDAQRVINPLAGRYWKIVNPSVLNHVSQPVGYKLVPGENILPFAHPDSSIMKRAGFISKHLWVTPYEPDEKYPAGDYPNQNPGGEGLPAWTQANRSIENTDVVVWYNFGLNHVARTEDWPIMPVAYIGFMLKPVGFFNANPSIDVPPSVTQHGGCNR